MEISLAAEPVISFFGLTITNSLLATFILTCFFLLFSWRFSKIKLCTVPKPKSLQNIIELIFEGLLSFFQSAAGEKTRTFFPLAATFFFFILFGNWIGLLPGFGSIGVWEVIHGEKVLVPLLRGVTADLNTTLALAIVSVASLQYYGLKAMGVKYIGKFINFSNPISFFVGILEIISEFAKILSFAFRLFGNIFAGEVLLVVMGFLMPFIAPLPFLGLELFVGLVQAIVFVMLTLVFLRVAVSYQH